MTGERDIRVTRHRLKLWRRVLIVLAVCVVVTVNTTDSLTQSTRGSGRLVGVWVNGVEHTMYAYIEWSGRLSPARVSATFEIQRPVWHASGDYRPLEPVSSYPLVVEQIKDEYRVDLRRSDGSLLADAELRFEGDGPRPVARAESPGWSWRDDYWVAPMSARDAEMEGVPIRPGDQWFAKGMLITGGLGFAAGVLLSLFPVLLIILLTQERLYIRLSPTQCRECGYDLRGVAGDACPECGTESRSRDPE